MRHFVEQMSPARRQLIRDESRAYGRMGIEQLPPIVHSENTSDSLMLECLDENSVGLAERQQEQMP